MGFRLLPTSDGVLLEFLYPLRFFSRRLCASCFAYCTPAITQRKSDTQPSHGKTTHALRRHIRFPSCLARVEFVERHLEGVPGCTFWRTHIGGPLLPHLIYDTVTLPYQLIISTFHMHHIEMCSGQIWDTSTSLIAKRTKIDVILPQ